VLKRTEKTRIQGHEKIKKGIINLEERIVFLGTFPLLQWIKTGWFLTSEDHKRGNGSLMGQNSFI